MAKKTARKKATKSSNATTKGKSLMVPVSDTLFNDFANFRNNRKDSRVFPWTVRDCMDIAIRDYLEKDGD